MTIRRSKIFIVTKSLSNIKIT